MQIEPKIRGFLCTTAHPKGCQQHIAEQVKQVKSSPHLSLASEAPENVLIIGGSAGYGLASRIVCGAGYGAKTLSISLEKPPKENKTASAGWYNNHYFQEWSDSADLPSYSIFGDAFSTEVKQQALELIREKMGSIDLVVYSLAAPRRTKVDPNQESVSYQSVIKPVGQKLDGYTVDTASSQLKAFHLEPASPQEISDTVAVMGGEDWFEWMKFLSDARGAFQSSANRRIQLPRWRTHKICLWTRNAWRSERGSGAVLPAYQSADPSKAGPSPSQCRCAESHRHPIKRSYPLFTALHFDAVPSDERPGKSRNLYRPDYSPV